MPRGQAQIEVTFELDANGILTVTAAEKSSGSENEITIKNDRNRLSEEQIAKMVAEAEASAEEDKKQREIANLRNQLQQMVFDAKDKLDSEKDGNFLEEISDEDKDKIEEACDEVNDWLQENEDVVEKQPIQDKIDYFDSMVRPVVRKYTKKTEKPKKHQVEDDLDYNDEL